MFLGISARWNKDGTLMPWEKTDTLTNNTYIIGYPARGKQI